MKHPLFSIVTIGFDNILGYKKTIASVLEQSNQNYEYIIVDGFSKDGSQEFLEKSRKKFDNLLIEKDKGIYDAMNKGLQLATGKYIIFMNSGDTFYNKSTLDLIEEKLSGLMSPDVIYGDALLKYGGGEERKHTCMLNRENLAKGKMPAHQSMIVKTSVLSNMGGFDTKLRIAADFKMCCALLSSGASARYFPSIISIFDKTGASNNKDHSYLEIYGVLQEYFSSYWSFRYKILNIYIDLTRMRLQRSLGLDLIARKIFLFINKNRNA